MIFVLRKIKRLIFAETKPKKTFTAYYPYNYVKLWQCMDCHFCQVR